MGWGGGSRRGVFVCVCVCVCVWGGGGGGGPNKLQPRFTAIACPALLYSALLQCPSYGYPLFIPAPSHVLRILGYVNFIHCYANSRPFFILFYFTALLRSLVFPLILQSQLQHCSLPCPCLSCNVLLCSVHFCVLIINGSMCKYALHILVWAQM